MVDFLARCWICCPLYAQVTFDEFYKMMTTAAPPLYEPWLLVGIWTVAGFGLCVDMNVHRVSKFENVLLCENSCATSVMGAATVELFLRRWHVPGKAPRQNNADLSRGWGKTVERGRKGSEMGSG